MTAPPRRAYGSDGGRVEPPTVSVVIPTYQREWCIGRSIRSVLDQTYQDFELIVVDDASTDRTRQVVTGFGDARIGYVRLENHRGPAAARNAGIRQSKGRFLAFQDSDDEWLPAKLERHLGAFDMCAPEVGVVHSDMQRVLRDATARYHQSPTIVPNALIDPDTRFYQFRNLGIQSSVIKRECFEHVGVFNETFPALEDLELFIRLSKRYRFHHLREALVRYYETDGLSKNVPAKLAARKLLLKHYWRDLAKGHLAFVVREYSFLRRAERQCAAARWGGT